MVIWKNMEKRKEEKTVAYYVFLILSVDSFYLRETITVLQSLHIHSKSYSGAAMLT
jgi:hypothetical protein